MLFGHLQRDSWMCVDPQYESGGEIANGKRETIIAIIQAELSLVISGPDIIRGLWDALGATGVCPAVSAPGLYQPLSSEDAHCS